MRVSGRMVFLTVAGAASVTLCAGGQGHVLRRSPPPLPPSPPSPQAYLLRAGPPELRFETADPSENAAAPTRYFPAGPKPATVEIPLPGKSADAVKNSSAPAGAAPAALAAVKAGSVLTAPGLNAENFAPGATDPAIVTPEMLAEYLKPSPPGKDNSSPAAVAPVKLGFTPPTPAADNQSRAVYKNE